MRVCVCVRVCMCMNNPTRSVIKRDRAYGDGV